jgi:hypothetical protein
MSGKVSASRKLTVAGEKPNEYITLGHLKGLVNLAAADGYPDDALVLGPQNQQGMPSLSIREGEA